MLSEKMIDWLDNFSQSAAVDMCEGGDDAECVVEICVSCMSTYEPELYQEWVAACAAYGRRAARVEAAKHVRTL